MNTVWGGCRARSVCTGDPLDLCYNKTAKYSGVLQVAILYIYVYIDRAVKNKRSSYSFRIGGHQTSVQYVGIVCRLCMMYED